MSGVWFHWAPRMRQESIRRQGLVPGKWSVDTLWRPPYICLSLSPSLAWALSGKTLRGEQIKLWDLWQVDISEQKGYEELRFDDSRQIKEIRVYERIYKRNVWYVGSRANGHGRRHEGQPGIRRS